MGCDGQGSTTTLVSGLSWIRANHPAGSPGVVNISLGADGGDALVDDAVARLVKAGLFVSVAAGNGDPKTGIGIDACRVSPARAASAYTVGATDWFDERVVFSNYGRCLDAFAPGVMIASVDALGEGDFRVHHGTSMASPHAAGAAALYLADKPKASPAQVEQVLDASALPVVTSAGSGSVRSLLSIVGLGDERSATRLAGASRYETAVAIADKAFPTSTEVVLVAGSQASVVDGLVAAPFAKHRKAPVLLSGAGSLGTATRAELRQRKPAKVWLIGGTGVLGRGVERELKGLGIAYERLSGADRYSTAATVARRMPSGSSAVLASGAQHNLIDAAAVSGPAAADGRPILLTAPAQLPSVTRTVIKDRKIASVRIIGGTGAVSSGVERKVRGLGIPVMRYGGSDRFATAANVATAFRGSTGTDTVTIASGNDANLIDAMTGGVLGHSTLLVRGTVPQKVTTDWMRTNRVEDMVVVGGTGAVTWQAVKALRVK
jgi:putative cell wall-binding protein